MAPRKSTKPTAAARVRHLIATDAANVMRRLNSRQQEMIAVFSRHRDRGPLLETIRSWFVSVEFKDLVELEPAEQTAVSAFYEQLGELRWYLQYTEDMPGQLSQRLVQHLSLLAAAHRRLSESIGGVENEGAQVVDSQVVGKKGS